MVKSAVALNESINTLRTGTHYGGDFHVAKIRGIERRRLQAEGRALGVLGGRAV